VLGEDSEGFPVAGGVLFMEPPVSILWINGVIDLS
jgi:hypothetical protein